MIVGIALSFLGLVVFELCDRQLNKCLDWGVRVLERDLGFLGAFRADLGWHPLRLGRP